MSFYNTPYFTVYDLLDSLGQRQQQQLLQQQYYPGYTRYFQPRPQPQLQPYYYVNPAARSQPQFYPNEASYPADDEDDDEAEEDDEEEDPRDTLYRSLYGDGPYVNRRSRGSSSAKTRPQIRRQPSLPRPSHPAESVIDLLNSLGANLSYPEDTLPTQRTFGENTAPLAAEQLEPTNSSPSGSESEQKPKSSSAGLLAQSSKRPPLKSLAKEKNSTLNLHGPGPLSPKLDPLQVSKPQLSKNLPFSPPINVYDRPQDYVIVVSIPGADKSSFHVDFHPTSHELIVKGEIKNKYHDSDVTNDKFVKVSEQRFGNFERNIKFPTLPKINDDQVKLSYNNGLLEIVLPKLSSTDAVKSKRRIEIEEVEDEELKREENGGFLN